MKKLAGSAAGLVLLLWLVASPVLAFPDVPASHPYAAAIEVLSERQVIAGRTDGTFGPSDPVWRSQFAKMISGVFELAPSEGSRPAPFADLGPNNKADLYPHEYVAAAYYAGITKGRTATSFAPYANITRAQVISMLVRGLDNRYPHLLEEPPAAFRGTWGSIAEHGYNARKAEWNQLLAGLGRTSASGDGNLARLDPWGKMSRGEVTQVLANVLTLLDDAVLLQDADLVRVVDGDTIEVVYGGENETVQLIGIRVPDDAGQAAQAKAALQLMLAGREIGLEPDIQECDSEGRLLAYVWYQEGEEYLMANWDLLGLGLAAHVPQQPNLLYQQDFQRARDHARQLARGMWGS